MSAVHSDATQIGKERVVETIRTIEDVRRFFAGNRRPISFIGHTTHHLLGIDAWVRGFEYICRLDCFEGRHPRLFIPREAALDDVPEEEVVKRLLQNTDVIDHLRGRGDHPAAVFLMFDERAEALCAELGIELWSPPAGLRASFGNKVETVRLGNAAGVPSVPNVLAKVDGYDHLMRLAREGGLGEDLVVQLPYGVSGQTTFFIAREDDWQRHEAAILTEPEIKIMKRISCRGSTLEACVTRCGTVVGPLLSELIGPNDLTLNEGAWCGNEAAPEAFAEDAQAKARDYAARFGDQLLEAGYRGYFDVDFLIDDENGEVYLGELNPRITAASPVTSRAHQADVPLFLFHLLEFSDAELDLDVAGLNARWADPAATEGWSEMVVGSTAAEAGIVTQAPPSGVWRLEDGGDVSYQRFDIHGNDLTEREAFFLRLIGVGDYRYPGVGLGILLTRGRVMNDGFELNERARAWAHGLTAHYRMRPLEPHEAGAPVAGQQ
jgi:D-alanine-D-alanine ligase-like ATP-grasp enzyme